jgi:hypothetical protein
MNPIRLTLLILSALSLACTGDPDDTSDTSDTGDTGDSATLLDPDFELALSTSGSCGNYYLYMGNADDTNSLHISGSGLAQQSYEAGEAITVSYTLPDEAINIRADVGINTTHESCNDAFWLEVELDFSYEAVGGTATVTMLSTGEPKGHGGYPGFATIVLEDVQLSAGEELPIVIIEELSMEGGMGWLPG